jgi:hypothetical protein
MASLQAVCRQGAVVRAVTASVARPAPCRAPLAPGHAGAAWAFAPQRPQGLRSRRMATAVQAASNGTGLPIDLRGEPRG